MQRDAKGQTLSSETPKGQDTERRDAKRRDQKRRDKKRRDKKEKFHSKQIEDNRVTAAEVLMRYQLFWKEIYAWAKSESVPIWYFVAF